MNENPPLVSRPGRLAHIEPTITAFVLFFQDVRGLSGDTPGVEARVASAHATKIEHITVARERGGGIAQSRRSHVSINRDDDGVQFVLTPEDAEAVAQWLEHVDLCEAATESDKGYVRADIYNEPSHPLHATGHIAHARFVAAFLAAAIPLRVLEGAPPLVHFTPAVFFLSTFAQAMSPMSSAYMRMPHALDATYTHIVLVAPQPEVLGANVMFLRRTAPGKYRGALLTVPEPTGQFTARNFAGSMESALSAATGGRVEITIPQTLHLQMPAFRPLHTMAAIAALVSVAPQSDDDYAYVLAAVQGAGRSMAEIGKRAALFRAFAAVAQTHARSGLPAFRPVDVQGSDAPPRVPAPRAARRPAPAEVMTEVKTEVETGGD